MHHKATANGYLMKISEAAIVRKKTRADIKRSINILSNRIDEFFGDKIREHGVFGSYQRKTILPRFLDRQADVDYMLLFEKRDVKPRAFLDRLRVFARNHYPRQVIETSHPSIIVELNHIRFELVPAVRGWFWGDLLIPAKTTEMNDWQSTDPGDFENKLTEKNQAHGNFMLPLVRVMKYWNILNGRPFGSFELESAIVELGYRSRLSFWFGRNWNLLSYLHYFSIKYSPGKSCQTVQLDSFAESIQTVKDASERGDQGAALGILHEVLPLPSRGNNRNVRG